METKDFNELKKQFKINTCNIAKLKGCYVDGDKNKVAYVDETFLNLPEEEQHKYLEFFKKAMSGGTGKCLQELLFKDGEGDNKKSLLALRDSYLKNDEILDAFYDEVIKTFNYVGNYLILLADQSYDVPAKATDGFRTGDSEEVYHYIICVICPLELSKAGLEFVETDNKFHNAERTFMIDAPMLGFLYPGFNDRSADINCVEFYSKNSKEYDSTIIEELFGCHVPTTAIAQNNIFTESIQEAFDNKCSYEVVENITNVIAEIVEAKEQETLTEVGISNILVEAGVEEKQVEKFKETFKEKMEENNVIEKEIKVTNMIPNKKTTYELNGLFIKANEEQNSFMDVKEIDGRLCLVIEVQEDLKVNGISVR